MEDDTTVLTPYGDRRRERRRSARHRIERIGPYQVFEQIASGGMGEVYAGQHCFLGRRVAIKVLHEHLANDPKVLDRFHAEAQATARIRHPGVVEVFDYGFDRNGRTFMVTELLEGHTLAKRMEAGPMPLPLVIEIGRQLASILAAVHAQDIVHRDIKPENIYLASDPTTHSGLRVKLIDFGLSKAVAPFARGLTAHGTILGTPLYMPPEQWRSDGVDHRVDVYAVGCLLYELACGVVPFMGRQMAELCDFHCHAVPTSPREIDARIPVWFERLILRMLAKLPHERPQSMLEVERELRGPDPADVPFLLAEGSSPGVKVKVRKPSRRSRRWLAPLALLFAAGAGIGIGVLVSPLLS